MSFEEYPEAFVWSCNTCDHWVAFKPHDFFGCVAELRARGWGFARSDEGAWEHWCPRCKPRLAQVLKMKAREVR
jgi:hypothetical protein